MCKSELQGQALSHHFLQKSDATLIDLRREQPVRADEGGLILHLEWGVEIKAHCGRGWMAKVAFCLHGVSGSAPSPALNLGLSLFSAPRGLPQVTEQTQLLDPWSQSQDSLPICRRSDYF